MHDPAPLSFATPLPSWHTSAAGQYVLGWQAERYAQACAGLFGYYALQLGCPALPTLAASRIAQRWLALQGEASDFAAPQLRLDYHALPLQEASVDLLTLPHTLEHSRNPSLTLRDAARALVPQGRLLISGFNPRGLWFSPTLLPRRRQLGLPEPAQLISLPALRQLLQTHGLQIARVHYGCWQRLRGGDALYPYAPRTELWGQRLLPHWGGCYMVEASKQVLGAHLLQAHWQNRWKILSMPQPSARTPPNSPAPKTQETQQKP